MRKNISVEAEKYGDILLGDYEDTYFNVNFKTFTNVRWISSFCDKKRHDTFLLIDDDRRVNLSMVIRFFANTPKSVLRHSLFGYISTTFGPVPNLTIKSLVTRREYAMPKFPPYPRSNRRHGNCVSVHQV